MYKMYLKLNCLIIIVCNKYYFGNHAILVTMLAIITILVTMLAMLVKLQAISTALVILLAIMSTILVILQAIRILFW